MGDQAMFLQTLNRAVQMLVQVDVVANRDGAWPERITLDKQLQYIKELRTILTYVRGVRDLVEVCNALDEQPADELTCCDPS